MKRRIITALLLITLALGGYAAYGAFDKWNDRRVCIETPRDGSYDRCLNSRHYGWAVKLCTSGPEGRKPPGYIPNSGTAACRKGWVAHGKP
jgi:hypothetical protein